MSGTTLLKKLLATSTMTAMAFAAASTVSAAHAQEVDPASDDPGTTIVGGGTQEEELPWISALHGGGSFTCTSSQIDAEWVLTAAHCVEGGGDYSVRIGSLTRSSGGTERDVAEVHMHPEYDWPHYDIALLRLAEPFENEYAPLATEADLELGQSSTIYGWGSENPDWSGPLPEDLKYSDGNTSEQGCDWDVIICIVGDGGVAGGDSGGPAFVQSAETGEWVQAGVCAVGYQPTDGTWSGYMSIPESADWIEEVAGV